MAWRIFRVVLVVYLCLVLALMLLEDKMIFFPVAYPEGDWNPAGLTFEDAHFTADDGTKLHGWFVPHASPRAVMLFSHGNAGNLSGRAEMLQVLHDRFGVAVMIYDYRGYGRSEGRPSEPGILQDARAARKWLAQRTGLAEADIVQLGRSLGSGVAVDLAVADGAAGLILEAPFTSMPDVAALHFPWLPVRRLMKVQLDSQAKIADYDGPVLIVHGTADEIIPYRLGRQLFDAAGEPKQFLSLEGMGHNDPFYASPAYGEGWDRFLNQLPVPGPSATDSTTSEP